MFRFKVGVQCVKLTLLKPFTFRFKVGMQRVKLTLLKPFHVQVQGRGAMCEAHFVEAGERDQAGGG
jgi:hypothetical protein